jgi:hypothetical protein
MTNCTSCQGNTLFIGRPTSDNNSCSSLNTVEGITNQVDIPLPTRPNRERVREQIKDYVLLNLGAPVVKIELDQQNLDGAVDFALQVYEDYCGREHYTYYTFLTVPGQSVYKMPDDVGLIRNVYYKKQGNFGFQGSDLGGALPIEYFYPGGAYASAQGGLIDPTQPMWGRMGEWVLYKQYEQMYTRISSQIGGWEWIGGLNHVKLYPIPCKSVWVSVQYLQKRPDFKQVTEGMQTGALAFAKIMLGRIRSKYQSLPGPQSGIQLDGQILLTEGREDLKVWREELLTRYGDVQLPLTMD